MKNIYTSNRIKHKGQTGITLIALVITIIVLIILAMISISMIIGNNGILQKANKAKETYSKAIDEEEENLEILSDNIDILLNQDNQYIENVIGKNFDNAVKNGYVKKSQYPYQITGSVKRIIEEKMGRKIDYSKDRFYEVNVQNLSIDNNNNNTSKKYIYNSSTGDVINITGIKTNRNISTWFWNGKKEPDKSIMSNKKIQDMFFDMLKKYNITQIYISVNTAKISNDSEFSNFVENAYNRDIKSYVVIGERDHLEDENWLNNINDQFDNVSQYNQSVDYSKKIAGISYDSEVWLNSEYNWKENETIRKKHIKFIQDAKNYANTKNLEVNFSLPFWLVQYDYTDDQGNVINMYDAVTKILDEVNLMIYRDNTKAIDNLVRKKQSDTVETVFDITKKNECTLNIAVETGQSEEGSNITFFEEETANQGTILNTLNELENLYQNSYNQFAFSIHHAIHLIDFLGGIKT